MTRMVGRDAELLILQNTFRDAIEDAETRVVTVVGEPGVGKSRLLYESENWIDLLPDEIWYFKGRTTPEMRAIPCSIIRDMFAYRFEILESDSAATVLDKFRAGMEGVHWADDSSRDLLDHLVTAVPDARLLVVCLARPPLFERRPNWGEGREAHTRLDLKPLSSRELVGEILQKVEDIADDLRDQVVDGAGGNPFYVEDGIILRGEKRWRVELDRLAGHMRAADADRGAPGPSGQPAARGENDSVAGLGGGTAVLGCGGGRVGCGCCRQA